jgi:hypothetical protein
MNVPHPFGHGTNFDFVLLRVDVMVVVLEETGVVPVVDGAACVNTFTTSNGVTTMEVTTAPIVPEMIRVDRDDFFVVP